MCFGRGFPPFNLDGYTARILCPFLFWKNEIVNSSQIHSRTHWSLSWWTACVLTQSLSKTLLHSLSITEMLGSWPLVHWYQRWWLPAPPFLLTCLWDVSSRISNVYTTQTSNLLSPFIIVPKFALNIHQINYLTDSLKDLWILALFRIFTTWKMHRKI